jgi:8-oxo-dGTP pyrophosphatase MutT (NUDIX family)
MAGWLFGEDADAALVQAIRIKSRALRGISAGNALNAFQWCKARLSKDHPAGLVAVQRVEADSKFFRSFAIVLLALAVIGVSQHSGQREWALSALCLGLLFPTLWRYIDLRFKSTQQAYWFVVTLESIKDHSDTPSKPNTSGLTHAGGVVFRKRNDTIEYLLIQAGTDANEWVLPKGHIELGESARETAVREVREETGYWARVTDWIDDVRLRDAPEAPKVRFLLMELVAERKKKRKKKKKKEAPEWPPENRQHRWLSLEASKQQASHKETVQLLEKAALAVASIKCLSTAVSRTRFMSVVHWLRRLWGR